MSFKAGADKRLKARKVEEPRGTLTQKIMDIWFSKNSVSRVLRTLNNNPKFGSSKTQTRILKALFIIFCLNLTTRSYAFKILLQFLFMSFLPTFCLSLLVASSDV